MLIGKEESNFLDLLIEHGGSLSEADIPEEMQTFWIDLLAEHGLVRRVPFSTQEAPDYHHPDGVWYGYIITTEGRAASADFKQRYYQIENRSHHDNVRRNENQRSLKRRKLATLIRTVIGWIIALVTWSGLPDVVAAIRSFFSRLFGG